MLPRAPGSTPALWLLWVLALLPGLPLLAVQDGTSRTAAPPPLVREELFELSLGPSGPPLGLAVARARWDGDVRQIEWHVHFAEEDTLVLHVERASERGSKLVWREVRPAEGRTLRAEWIPERGELTVLEWGRPQGERSSIDAAGGALMPLQFLELVRTGALEEGTFRLFDPLSKGLETVDLVVRSMGAPGTPAAREAGASQAPRMRAARVRRADGTLVGEYLFRGEELLRVRWQEGGLVGRRVEPGAFTAAAGELGISLPGR